MLQKEQTMKECCSLDGQVPVEGGFGLNLKEVRDKFYVSRRVGDSTLFRRKV